MQSLTQLGLLLDSTDLTPNQALDNFRRLDADGDINRILQGLIPRCPVVLQARSELEQARHDLEQAEPNLRYCNVVSDIDGVVTSRNVNPGNAVQVGQSSDGRALCQRRSGSTPTSRKPSWRSCGSASVVRCEVDMYGGRKEFEGRITGFTMGTGQTLALLPPQNATGTFVKIVQRLPVRIELTNYDPLAEAPLFVGLSVHALYVYHKEPPTGRARRSGLAAVRNASSTAPQTPNPDLVKTILNRTTRPRKRKC